MFRCFFFPKQKNNIKKTETEVNIFQACMLEQEHSEQSFNSFSKNILEKEHLEKINSLTFDEIKILIDIIGIYYVEDGNNSINFPIDNENLYIYSRSCVSDFTDLETRRHINRTSFEKFFNYLNEYNKEEKRQKIIKFLSNY